MNLSYTAASLALAAFAVLPRAAADADPLFQSDERLHVRIEAPITTLMRERPDKEELDGTLSYIDDTGREIVLEVEIRTRGNYRRQERICPFAPVRLDFDKGEVGGTLFRRQNRLKLVTHCRNATRFEQAAIREYLVYRMFNRLTDQSYRVRPLTITYVDTDDDGRENTRFGFLIESRKRFGARTGWSVFDTESVDVAELDPRYASLVAVFQYFAGNTDYSMIRGADGENCCHNTNLFKDGSAAMAVPYDFDMSGLVDASYASPNPRLGLRSNRDRLYRGRCSHAAALDETLALFVARREALYALIDDEIELTSGSRNGMTRFLNHFYKTLDNPRAIDREFRRTCAAP